jgi:hypothetical protein
MMDHITKYTQALNDWYATPLGQCFKGLEARYLKTFLATLHGDHLVQVGGSSAHMLNKYSPIAHQLMLMQAPCADFAGDMVLADPESLPLRPQSVDVVLLPHVLAGLQTPDDCLADVSEALVVGGHVVIMGFNPISLLRLSNALCLGKVLPKALCWHSCSRIRRCLHALGFSIEVDISYFFRPAVQRQSWLHHGAMLDTLGQFLWPHTGGGYMMVAQKSATLPVHVKTASQRNRRAVVLGGAAEPAGFDAGDRS